MTLFLLILINIIQLVCIIYFAGLAWHLWFTAGKRKIFYYPTKLKHVLTPLVDTITQYVPDTTQAVLYEVGAGLGRVSVELDHQFDWKRMVALDIEPLVIVLGKLFTRFKGADVEYIRSYGDEYDYGTGNVLYVYLSTPILNDMHNAGVFAGNLVITLTFQITNEVETEIVPVGGFQQQLNVYDFR